MTELEFVRDLAERAGTLAVAATRSLTRELKADQSLVTNIDRAVEEMVRREVAERFPGDAFYGEECGGDPRAAGRVWLVDPVDGTTNMVFGLPIWGVSIGLAVDGRPALGVFHLPVTRQTYWFQRGEGAYLNDTRLQVSDVGPLLQEDPIGIGSEAFLILEYGQFRCRPRNFGSLAAHWCYTGAGQLRANISVQEKLHDLGAAWGIVEEAGCVIEYLDGGAVPFSGFLENPVNYRPMAVGHPRTLDRIREVLRERPSGIDCLSEH